MAQPAVTHFDNKTDLLDVPVFWGKTSAEPLFPWKTWTGQFFHSISLDENCEEIVLLTEPAPIYDDPTPRPELFLSTETTDEAKRRTARKIAKSSVKRRKKASKVGPKTFYQEDDNRVKVELVFALGHEEKKIVFQQNLPTNVSKVKFKLIREHCNHCPPAM